MHTYLQISADYYSVQINFETEPLPYYVPAAHYTYLQWFNLPALGP